MNAIVEFIKPEFLINLTLKTSLILALTGLLSVLLQHSSAALRHWVWSMAFLGVLVFPILSSVLPAWQLQVLPTAFNKEIDTQVVGFEQGLPVSGPNRQTNLSGLPLQPASPTGQQAIVSNTSMPPKSQLEGNWFSTIDWAVWVFFAWIAGVLFVLIRTLFEISGVAWIARKGEVAGSQAWRRTIRKLKNQSGIKRPVSAVFSRYTAIPLTFGMLRPVILLPKSAEKWPERQKQTVILHELAHVKRHDYITNLITHFVCALYWYNPLIWIAARQLQVERERATDDYVLRAGTENIDYANQLLAIASPLTRRSDFGCGVIAMAKHSQIKKRMQHILAQKIRRHSLTRVSAIVAIFAVAAIIIPLAVVHLQARQDSHTNNSLQELIADLKSDETAIQKQAAWALGEREETRAVPWLIDALRDKDTEVRAMAAWALGEIKDPQALNPLLAALNEQQNDFAREMLARAIGELEDARAVQPLLDLLKDPEPGVRVAALWALGEIGERSTFYTVIKMLNDQNDKVRAATLSALRGIGCDPAFVAVTLSLRDASAAVRYAAAKLLGEFTDKPTNEPVHKVLVDYSPSFPPILQEVFGEFENLSAIDYLIQVLADPVAQVRVSAAETLGIIGHPGAVAALMTSLQDSDPDVRAMAVWALDEINI